MKQKNYKRSKVFISYSHRDKVYLDRLRVHLKPLERDYKIEIWDDRKIRVGDRWRDEIRHAIETAKVAVLIISADFLASDFIAKNELPPLLTAAEREGAIIMPLIVSPSRFEKTKSLSIFQAVNEPSLPLVKLKRAQQEAIFVKLSEHIENSLRLIPKLNANKRQKEQIIEEALSDINERHNQQIWSGIVRGTEIAQPLASHLEIKKLFRPNFPPTEKIEKGIAALAIRLDEPGTDFVPISVRLSPSETATVEVPFTDQVLQTLANEAVQWTANYARRFKGSLRRAFHENHWGSHKAYGCAQFYLPEGKYEFGPALFAGMVIAYLTAIINNILNYDLDMSIEFPMSLFLCAAGFKSDSNIIIGADGFAEAVAKLQLRTPARLIYAREQQYDVCAIPSDVRSRPVDNPNNVIEEWFRLLMDEIKSPAETHYILEFKQSLNDLLCEEKNLKDAEAAQLSREARLREQEDEILMLQRELEFLNGKITEIQQKLIDHDEIPLPSQVLAEYTQMREDLRAQLISEKHQGKDEHIKVIIIRSEESQDTETCRRLYRRLANLCHPDKKPEQAMWFTHLVEHRHDRIWLESMEGALDPFGSQLVQSKMNDSVSQLFERLFALQATKIRLKERINDLKSDVVSYGDEWRTHLGEEEQKRNSIIDMCHLDIDQAWRQLNRLLGKELFSSPGYKEDIGNG